MKNRKIIYLVNPVSGTSTKEALLKVIEHISNERGIQHEFVHTNALGDYDFLADKILKEQVTDIVIIGGDGTVNQVVNALRHLPVTFGIIPFGSGNGLAYAAGIPKKPKQALDLVLTGGSKKVDAFIINNQFSCMLSGIGFDAKVAHDFAAKATRGLFTYTQQSLLNFFKAQPYQFEVLLDGFSFFNNVTIAPHADLNDGLLDIVIVQKMNKAKLPFAVLRQIRGNNKLQELVDDISQKNILYFQTPSITIRNLKLAPFHIDGEPKETHEQFEVNIIKDCFELIQPA